jgi:N-acetyl-alpha-D-glucosaminyl L-malate synthase BshA
MAIAPQGERLIVHTSNFRKVKRVQDVVKIFKKIRAKLPSKLLLIGDGPERHQIEELCRELDLGEDVRFLGKQELIEEVLSICDLFIMPSETESFGLAALEAMACQVPVITSDAGGIPELNLHGVTGFMSPVGDVESMASHALEILADDATLLRFKKAALERAREFDIDRILPLYEAYYGKVVGGGKK